MKNVSFIFSVLATMLLLSCSNSKNSNVEFIPFLETSDGQWGMINLNGTVLFSEEFKSKPTVVKDQRFFVQSTDGYWEMYDAVEKPQKIGADYAHISCFQNGVALVAEKGEPVSIIDVDGKIIKLLDNIGGKRIDGVRTFKDGFAVFVTSDSLQGIINQNGECVVKPDYITIFGCGDEKFIAINKKYKKGFTDGNEDKVKFSILNTKGNVIHEFKASKYNDIKLEFSDGLLPVNVKKEGKVAWGLINEHGDEIVKPSVKIKDIGIIKNNKFTYSNGEGWGLMDTNGNILIRAKYDFLYFDGDNVLIAGIKRDGDNIEYKYVDEEDNQLGDEIYVSATPFTMFDSEHAIVKPNDKIYTIIDRNGKSVENLPDIVNVGTNMGEDYIQSDYVDFQQYIKDFKISNDEVFGISFKTTPAQIIKLDVEDGSAISTEEHKAGDLYWYDWRDFVDLYKYPDKLIAYVKVKYTGKLTKQTYRTKRIIDYTIGDWYWYHDDKIPTGYVYNDVRIEYFDIEINNGGRMFGKLHKLLQNLSTAFGKIGTIVKKNNGAVVISTKTGHTAFLHLEKNKVLVQYGNLGEASKINIDEYKDATEEGEKEYVSYNYLNSLFPDKEPTDSIINDTEAVSD